MLGAPEGNWRVHPYVQQPAVAAASPCLLLCPHAACSSTLPSPLRGARRSWRLRMTPSCELGPSLDLQSALSAPHACMTAGCAWSRSQPRPLALCAAGVPSTTSACRRRSMARPWARCAAAAPSCRRWCRSLCLCRAAAQLASNMQDGAALGAGLGSEQLRQWQPAAGSVSGMVGGTFSLCSLRFGRRWHEQYAAGLGSKLRSPMWQHQQQCAAKKTSSCSSLPAAAWRGN